MTHQKLVTEIRFIPNPQIIDIRGKLASAMVSDEFKDWVTTKDRVEVRSSYGAVFVSYNSLGFITLEETKTERCLERLDEALKILGDLPPQRWGVRIFTLFPSKKNFLTILNKYKSHLLNFKPSNFSKINGELVDVGVSYIFKKDHDTYHLTTGPMKKDQAIDFFPDTGIPANGIFIDLDIYRERDAFYKGDFSRSRIKEFIAKSFNDGQGVLEEISELLND